MSNEPPPISQNMETGSFAEGPISASRNERAEGGKRTAGSRQYASSRKPYITVITVVFNGAATIEDTIRSVAGQTYKDVEYIIIDGGSTDATLDIIRRHEEGIDYWVSEKDKGIYDAMNKGIALAKGEYVGMLNADDFFAEPTSLQEIASRLKESNVDVVFSSLDIVYPDDLNRVLRRYRVSSYNRFMLRIGVMPPHPTFYCRKSCYEEAGPYRTDFRIAADFEMTVRLLLKQHVTWRFLDETTVKMRAGGLSTRGLRSSWLLNREIIRACNENGLYTNMLLLALKLPIRLLELGR